MEDKMLITYKVSKYSIEIRISSIFLIYKFYNSFTYFNI